MMGVQEVQRAANDSKMSFFDRNFDISSLDASVTLIYPSLASCPHTAAAASVVIATALL